MSAGPATTARSNAGWNAIKRVTTAAAVAGNPALRKARKQKAAMSASSPAATRADAGVSAGASQARSVLLRNGRVG